MSALLASSFVGRVAAFKATKVQVRFFSWNVSSRTARERRDARAIVARGNERAEMRIGRGGSSNEVDRGVSTRSRTRER